MASLKEFAFTTFQETQMASSAADVPTLEQLLARAAELRPLIRARAQQTEDARRVSAEVSEMLVDAGLYRVVQPRRFGGYEFSLDDLRRLVFEVGQGCASTAWCYSLGATNSWFVGMFSEEAQHDVWGNTPDALIAGSIAPTGTIRRVDGGFTIKGRWGFASNCDNARWLTLGGMLDEGDGKPPYPTFLLVPDSQYTIIHNWNTVGLAGTGSKDVTIDAEVFVPGHRSVSFAQALNQETPGLAVNRNPMYRIPFLSGFPPMLANPAVTALRGAIDEFLETVAPRATRGAFTGSGSTLAQFGHVQSALAEAEAAVDAAQLILGRDLRLAAELSERDDKVSVAQRIEFRRGHAYAVRLCVGAINDLYDVVGGTGISLNNGVQRAWRDINAVAHHISVNWHAVSTMYGQMRLGLPPRGQY